MPYECKGCGQIVGSPDEALEHLTNDGLCPRQEDEYDV